MTCCSGFPGGCGTIDIHWETNEEFGGVYDVTALRFYSSSWCKFMEAYMYILAQTNYEENYNKYNIFQTRYRRCLLFWKPLIKWIFIQIMEEFHEKYGGAVGSHDIRSDARKVWHCLKKNLITFNNCKHEYFWVVKWLLQMKKKLYVMSKYSPMHLIINMKIQKNIVCWSDLICIILWSYNALVYSLKKNNVKVKI